MSTKQKYSALLLFGPPGCGKGTQGKFLSQVGGHFHLSSGEIFRGLDPQSEMGKLFHSYVNRGELGPDELTIGIWKEHMEGLCRSGAYHPDSQLLILDGIPRTRRQAEQIAPYIDLKKVVLFEIGDPEELIIRLKGRALKEGRKDDQDEAVLRRRMEVYEEQTREVIDYYPESLILRIKADQKPIRVFRDLLNGINPL